ncbi:hypothetical protein [Streptomyces pactum]|uniref:hypothetical protein n=1 Tax=Streptomyces pactum TaxID=68249 RepID=UPI0036F84063
MTEDREIPNRPADAPAGAAPVPRQRGIRSNPWAAGLAGLLVGAALTGAVWLVVGGEGDDDDGPAATGPDRPSAAPRLPDKLGMYPRFGDAAGAVSHEGAERTARRVAEADERSATSLSAAYGGAPAAVQTYTDQEMTGQLMLTAVRAGSPEPFAPYEDAAALGLAEPTREVVRVGEVACVVHNQPVPARRKPGPETVNVEFCQRTEDGLTVQVRGVTAEVRTRPEDVAALVEEAWSALD